MVSALEHEMFDDGILSVGEQMQSGLEFVGAEICEEAESSEVDTENGELSGTELSAAPEDASVAAEDDDHIGIEILGDGLCGPEFADEADVGLCSEPGLERSPAVANVAGVAPGEDDEFEWWGWH
jgi:hypothetical protein